MKIINEFDQLVGEELLNWKGSKSPNGEGIIGNYCRLERLSVEKHSSELYSAYSQAPDSRDWTYLAKGPFNTLSDYQDYLDNITELVDPIHYAIIDLKSNKPVGTVALMRIDSENGVIEIGHITYSPLMKRSRISTEVFFLLLNYIFKDLGFRRLEWKCDSLNAPSIAAAKRFGFTLEGVFRQAIVTRSRNRDTAWFSIIDSEFDGINSALNDWLSPSNFDSNGNQLNKLSELRLNKVNK